MSLGQPCLKNAGLLHEKFPTGITNGAEWYEVPGGMQDYNYMQSNCFEITIEMGCDKFPDHTQIHKYWKDHRDPLLRYMEQVITFFNTLAVHIISNAAFEKQQRYSPVTNQRRW